MAHGNTDVAKFSDPTALALLPDGARERVERMRSGAPAATRRERLERKMLEKRTAMMIARTVAIDEVVRAAASPQVVILGAGYDGRAWRMPELENVVVFEVDHPDTQGEKRTRTPGLRQAAREVHFVPVDFSRDDLGDALAAAGHDPSRPTTWIWEGVVMYLERADIEATLSVLARRSAPGSRLTIAYVAPVFLRWLIGLMLRRIGEPFRSIFTAEQMRELLARHGFRAGSDEDIVAIAKRLSPALERDARAIRHLRIVTAEKS
jgi:methyltransferase (TIGR00027 family)